MSLSVTAEGMSYASAYKDIKLNSLVLFLHNRGIVSQVGREVADAVAIWSGWWWPLPLDAPAAAAFSRHFESLLSMTHSMSRLYKSVHPLVP